ncbi:HAAS signaling domain-containing protein [Streptomyces sp. NPDC101118]|uniref:HAAS signaling domain-containing protein n=1 Tax=Streptomyces sp. NPDC101118 TaxID=3366109 RepID=UPI003821427B
MNAIAEHPLVTAYLAAVSRETAELPAERRAELLSDLREHVQDSGAEGEEQIREVLEQLGDPRTVAASALAEEPAAAPSAGVAAAPATPAAPAEPLWRTRVTVGLLACASLLVLANFALGGVALLAGLVLLWSSAQWERREKVLGTATSVAVPVMLLVGALVLAAVNVGPVELLVIAACSVAVPGVGAMALLRTARR